MKPFMTVIVALGIFCFLLPVVRHTGAGTYLNVDALLIIFGGSVIGLLVGFPLRRIRMTLIHVKEAFQEETGKEGLVKDILAMARLYKRGEIREMERQAGSIQNRHLRLGIQLLIDHRPLAEIGRILEREAAERNAEVLLSQNLLRTLARLTPALGLAGTIVSLIKMFDQFQSIETVTPMMALALLSTFYGVVLSNLVMLPLSSKLKDKLVQGEMLWELTLEGLASISRGEHPLRIEERLLGIPPFPEEGPLTGKTPVWRTVNIKS